MIRYVLGCLIVLCASGCVHLKSDNGGQVQSYAAPAIEPAWIRDGEPIVYNGTSWYPARDVENFLDSEVYQVGEYKGTPIFVDKVDIKPYERLYTKFAKGKFRYFVRSND